MIRTAPSISIIAVNYNGGKVLQDFAESIIAHISLPVELIIYDNASKDESMKLLPDVPQIKQIKSEENLGFAKGNNRAARAATGQWFHFLNPDILVNKQLNSDYTHVLEGPENRLYVNSLIGPDGKAQQMQMLIPTLSNYVKRIFTPTKAKYWSIGASVIMHRDTFAALKGWSEDYFMYSEDLDLFFTAHQMGIEVVHLNTGITHIGKVSSASAWSPEQRACVIEGSVKTFYRKHRNLAEYAVVRSMQLMYQLVRRDPEFKPSAKAFIKTLVS